MKHESRGIDQRIEQRVSYVCGGARATSKRLQGFSHASSSDEATAGQWLQAHTHVRLRMCAMVTLMTCRYMSLRRDPLISEFALVLNEIAGRLHTNDYADTRLAPHASPHCCTPCLCGYSAGRPHSANERLVQDLSQRANATRRML